jgi:hypothetical protein
MDMRAKLYRLFRPSTRLEVFFLIWAMALGATERAKHYLETVPGASGVILAVACTAVVFVAGGMLLDFVRKPEAAAPAAAHAPVRRRRTRAFNRTRRMSSPKVHGEASRG